MKTLRNISMLMLTGLMISSCSDLLETVPNYQISTTIFWKTDKDATLGANAVYAHLAETGAQNTNTAAAHYVSWDGMTDIGYTNLPQSPESFILQGQFDALNSRLYYDYIELYAGVRSANAFMDNIGTVQTTNTALIARLTGEVRALRAYYYMRLAMLYGDVTLVTKSNMTLAESKKVTRNPVSEIWDFVSTELTEAAALLPATQTDKGRLTKGAALSIKARAMLHAGRFQDAIDAASAVMASGTYNLFPTYKTLFTTPAENNIEVILDVEYSKVVTANDIFGVLAQRSVGARSLFVPTKKLVDAYQMTNGLAIGAAGSGFDPFNPYNNRDPRMKYSVFVPGDLLPNGAVFNPKPTGGTSDAVGSSFTVSPTGFNVKKYVNNEDLATPNTTGINFILIRYAEVLLTYAEAKIELNQLDVSVYDAINKVRQRGDVLMPVITAGKTQDELRVIVRQERLVELAFEGQHYFDIRRWKTAETVMPGKVFGMTWVDASSNLQTVEVPAWTNSWNNKNYLWPVPQPEKDMNPALGQNPGW